MRFELTTSTLAMLLSTAEIHLHGGLVKKRDSNPGGNYRSLSAKTSLHFNHMVLTMRFELISPCGELLLRQSCKPFHQASISRGSGRNNRLRLSDPIALEGLNLSGGPTEPSDMVLPVRIELTFSRYDGEVLPLYHRSAEGCVINRPTHEVVTPYRSRTCHLPCIWYSLRESNSRLLDVSQGHFHYAKRAFSNFPENQGH